jgi:signal transduction histidine kinase
MTLDPRGREAVLPALGLRGRLAAALTGLSVGAVVLLALAFWAGEKYLERDSLQRLVQHEAQSRPITPVDRADLDYNADLARRRGYWLLGLLLGGTAALAASAWWLSGRIARRSLRPLGELVEQIRGIDLERRDHRLQLATPDPELQVIVAALNAHMAELDALVQRERAFAAAASHELRTPLTVIGGAAAVLGALPDVPPAVLARIDRAVAQARRDLEALLALSRGRETESPERTRLDLLLPEIAALQAAADGDAGTRIHWDLGAPLEREMSVGALSIIFGNVLRNALRAARGGDIRIRLGSDGISVSDSGPGLPAGMLGRPLQPLASRGDGGSGLGLYIAQTLAERYGWALSLGRADGGGARVELRFHA